MKLRITSFSRDNKTLFEWANLAWLPYDYFMSHDGAAFEKISADLPIKCCEIKSYEIDTPADLEKAEAYYNHRE